MPLSWALIVLAFFSASPGKRDMYILPALPAFALAAAPFLADLAQKENFRRVLWLFVLGLGLLLLGLGASALFAQPKFATALVDERGLGPEVRWLWLMLASSGAILIIVALACRATRAGLATAIALVTVWAGYGFVAHPVLDPSSSSRAMMQQARVLAGADTQIGLIDWKEQNLLQAIGPTEEFGFLAPERLQLRRGTDWLKADPEHRRLLVPQTGQLACLGLATSQAPLVAVANRRSWRLLSLADVGDACAEATSP